MPQALRLRVRTLGAKPDADGRRGITTKFDLHNSARHLECVPWRVASRRADGARYRAADAMRCLPRAGQWRRRLRKLLGEAVVYRAATLPEARHSLCLRSRSRIVVDGGDIGSASLWARPSRGAL